MLAHLGDPIDEHTPMLDVAQTPELSAALERWRHGRRRDERRLRESGAATAARAQLPPLGAQQVGIHVVLVERLTEAEAAS